MTPEQVELGTSWGEAIEVHRTVTADGQLEQRVYLGNRYGYFRDGVLVDMQD